MIQYSQYCHDQQPIIQYCLLEECQEKRGCCQYCLNYHNNHYGLLIREEIIKQFICNEESQNINNIDKITFHFKLLQQNIIQKFTQLFHQLKELKQNNLQQNNINFQNIFDPSLNYEEQTKIVRQLNQVAEIYENNGTWDLRLKQSQQDNQLKQFFEHQKESLENIFQQLESYQIQVIKDNSFELPQFISQNSTIIEHNSQSQQHSLQQDLNEIPFQELVDFRFNPNLCCTNFTLLNDRRNIKRNDGANSYFLHRYGLVDQAIQKFKRNIVFGFEFLKQGYLVDILQKCTLYLGVANVAIVKQNNFIKPDNYIGAYLIGSDGLICCDNPDYVERRDSFPFQPGDTILCFYNFKANTLKFNKFRTNLYTVIPIKTNVPLNPCVCVNSLPLAGAEIRIINEQELYQMQIFPE
ncbi:hypothetical protein pb186bvf_007721 [Paramecium bursaria]